MAHHLHQQSSYPPALSPGGAQAMDLRGVSRLRIYPVSQIELTVLIVEEFALDHNMTVMNYAVSPLYLFV